MKKLIAMIGIGLSPFLIQAQTGHIMQGIGATNMSMGGAATAQPIDISGALQWNPASITAINDKTLSANVGLFFSSPELSSTVPTGPNSSMSGKSKDDRGVSPMPAVAYKFGKKNSKHHFGISAFGISGFGVTFNESNTNPINFPQSMGGFGQIKSDYQLMQVSFTYAVKLCKHLSIGFSPAFNAANLSLSPNPLASPNPYLGYPKSNKAGATGWGAQAGIYYQSLKGLKLGVSYKTKQTFKSFNFSNRYLDGSEAPNVSFKMNYPAIFSVGIGYSNKAIDVAADYRTVNYEKTEGFNTKGWSPTASVNGFGWKNISIVSAGIQYKGVKKIPLRVGYTYSSNPIDPTLAFFSTPATAIIKHAFQLGFGFELNKKATFNTVYHYGTSGGATKGQILNPMMISETNPYGAIPGSEVSYTMKTSMLMFGITYRL
ncbi:MAG: OmpP1/FadL family transporter [Ferruginibacter sp.]